METFKELWDSVRLNLLDRLGNPLVGAFTFSWLIWNFRLLLVAFGDGDWKPKIDYIDKVLMPNWSDWLVHGYLVPLSISLVWVFILPIVFRKVMVFHRSQLAKTAKAVMVADEQVPISHEEAMRLRLKLRDMTAEWELEKETYLRQNEELSERIAILQKHPPSDGGDAISETRPEESGGPELPSQSNEFPDSLDPLVAVVGHLEGVKDGKSLWPRALGQRDLDQLPSSVVAKVRGFKFEIRDIQALLSMRNWPIVDPAKLARALSIEAFDAQVTVDRLKGLKLISSGTDGLFLNADGRMLTSYFKRVFTGARAAPTAFDGSP